MCLSARSPSAAQASAPSEHTLFSTMGLQGHVCPCPQRLLAVLGTRHLGFHTIHMCLLFWYACIGGVDSFRIDGSCKRWCNGLAWACFLLAAASLCAPDAQPSRRLGAGLAVLYAIISRSLCAQWEYGMRKGCALQSPVVQAPQFYLSLL